PDSAPRAHPRRRDPMHVRAHQLRRVASATDGGLLDWPTLADQSNDTAIVVRIRLAVEQIDAVELHGRDDGIQLRPITAFRKIGDTFDQRGHTRRISVTRTSCNFGALCVL